MGETGTTTLARRLCRPREATVAFTLAERWSGERSRVTRRCDGASSVVVGGWAGAEAERGREVEANRRHVQGEMRCAILLADVARRFMVAVLVLVTRVTVRMERDRGRVQVRKKGSSRRLTAHSPQQLSSTQPWHPRQASIDSGCPSTRTSPLPAALQLADLLFELFSLPSALHPLSLYTRWDGQQKKGQKMDLNTFLADESESFPPCSCDDASLTLLLQSDTGGSWADEMDMLPTGRKYSHTFPGE